jgi:excisionase family DNA binding protein
MVPNDPVEISLEPLLVGAAEAANLLGIGRSLFYQMSATGQLGPMPIRFGKRRLWRFSELKAWVEAGCPKREVWINLQEKVYGKSG